MTMTRRKRNVNMSIKSNGAIAIEVLILDDLCH